MAKRKKMSRKMNRRVFKKGSLFVKKKNLMAKPMRGGFRI